MKKDSGSVKINVEQESVVREYCLKLGFTRSDLFREVLNWGLSANLPISKQYATFRFSKQGSKTKGERDSFMFGSKLSQDLIMRIEKLCNLYGVRESHLYRSFLDEYMRTHSHNIRLNTSAPRAGFNSNNPSIFTKPTYSNIFPKPDTNTLLGRMQADRIHSLEKAQQLGDFFGLTAVLIYSAFTSK